MSGALDRHTMAVGGYMPIEFHTPDTWIIIEMGEEILHTHNYGDEYHRDQALDNFKLLLDMLGLEYE